MFNTVLLATDISKASDCVVNCLGGLRALGAERVILAHALGIKHLESMKYALARDAEPYLLAQKAALEGHGYEVSIEVAPGLPAFEINRLANQIDPSLIVVGSHGRTMAKEAVFGSVAFEIAHLATKPLLVIRLKIVEGEGGNRCEVVCSDLTRNVLYPTDFSDTAERAFAYVEKIVESGCKRVTLLHVQDRSRIGKHLESRLEEFNKIDSERLARLKARLVERGATDVRVEIPYGSPISEVLKQAREGDYSLIVMGSQGRGFIAETFLGSVSHNVVRQAPTPVLLVPALR